MLPKAIRPNFPGLGAFPDISNESYHRMPGWSSTTVKAVRRSPAHAMAQREKDCEPLTPTKARHLLVGNATHTMILEPHLFDTEFAMLPGDIARMNKNTKKFKEGYAEFVEVYAQGRGVLYPDEVDQLRAMRDAVWSNREAERYLSGENRRREWSVWAERDVQGYQILTKCRPDIWIPQLLLDLKTTDDASPRAYSRTIARYGYHVQGAWYTDVLEAHGKPVEMFGHLVVEKEPPYGVMVYRIHPSALELGRTIIEHTLPTIVQCEKSGKWPAYPSEVRVIDVPAWAYTEAEFEHESEG